MNGKDLNCPNEKQFLSNEIRIFEIASETTFRSVIVRRSDQENVFVPNMRKTETVQLGDVPEPSYGSTLVRVPALDGSGTKAAIKFGGAVMSNRNMSALEHIFTAKKVWEEESTSEFHILKYNVVQKIFEWKLVKVEGLEPRAFHSAVLIDQFIFIFGGLDIKNSRRLPVMPIRVNISDWSVSCIVVDGLEGFLSGAACLPCADKVYLVGGYKDELVTEVDKPGDTISEITFSTQGIKRY